MTLAVYVMHVPGIPERVASLSALLDRVPTAVVMSDPKREGAWWNARRCWEAGIASGAEWIVVMNDDALPCRDFVRVAEAALATRSPRDPVCFFASHPRAQEAKLARWYTSPDGFVGVACALHRLAAIEFLAWHDANLTSPWTDDGRVKLWAMATKRLVYSTVPSLVDHQLPASSLVGNEGHDARKPELPPLDDMTGLDWREQVLPLGRHYVGNHWELPFRTRPDSWDLEQVYEVAREGATVEPKLVFIATPAYGGPELAFLQSVSRVVEDLQAHGYQAIHYMTGGDSLVTRGRHVLCHDFLCSCASYFLQWDADVEVEDPTCVRRMIETGHDIVGGAYPFRDGSGTVVANPLAETRKLGSIDIINDCVRVAEVGTGFLLLRRRALIDMQKRHPELLYEADMAKYGGCPMWALFDVALEANPNNPTRKRYASEDWRFCSLARDAGYDVWCYVPPTFRHWGKVGHRGHITEAWGFGDTQKAAAE